MVKLKSNKILFGNSRILAAFWLLAFASNNVSANHPAAAHYYPQQLVDHLSSDKNQARWSQRYYTSSAHFAGPGSPIFLILGGEGTIAPGGGLNYPFVSDHLAAAFGAFVIHPEHRFYGFSQPLLATATTTTTTSSSSPEGRDGSTTSLRKRALHTTNNSSSSSHAIDPRVQLFTSEQALLDAVRLVQHVAYDQLHCSPNKTLADYYCPIITVGGSYPGFLSAMARLRFPDVIDMAYAASAPMGFYSQQVHPGDYYNHITQVAEKTLPGCSKAVQDTLEAVHKEHHYYDSDLSRSSYIPALEVGICPGTLPNYATKSTKTFFKELFMMVGYSFANDNMANYPPSPQTRLYKSCEMFLDTNKTASDRLKTFLVARLGGPSSECFSMTHQLPTGPNATITGGDWSGDGTGADGESWDFQTCTLLVEKIGFSKDSMFPARNWTLEWMTDHCQSRFGVTPRPTELVDKWKFNDLVKMNASRILFTNGLNDGWSVGAVKTNLSESLLALNFENGAHHSDLNPVGPMDNDTDDIRQGYKDIQNILSKWLKEVKDEATQQLQ